MNSVTKPRVSRDPTKCYTPSRSFTPHEYGLSLQRVARSGKNDLQWKSWIAVEIIVLHDLAEARGRHSGRR